MCYSTKALVVLYTPLRCTLDKLATAASVHRYAYVISYISMLRAAVAGIDMSWHVFVLSPWLATCHATGPRPRTQSNFTFDTTRPFYWTVQSCQVYTYIFLARTSLTIILTSTAVSIAISPKPLETRSRCTRYPKSFCWS